MDAIPKCPSNDDGSWCRAEEAIIADNPARWELGIYNSTKKNFKNKANIIIKSN